MPGSRHSTIAGVGGGVLAARKRDGRPQLANVDHHYDPEERIIRVSVSDGDAKTRNLRRDPRAGYHVTSADRSAYTVAECTAEVTPVADGPDDAAVEELIGFYRAIEGEHSNWADYRRWVVENRQVLLKLKIERAYGLPRE